MPDEGPTGPAALSRPAVVRIIAEREIRDHLLSLKFYVCTLTMALLVGLSVVVMARDFAVRMDNYSVLRERARPRPGESGVMAVVEPRPLSVFAKGLDETMDRGYTIQAYTGISPHDRQTQAVSLFSLFAPPDLLYIVKVLLSLIAVLFAYDAVAGEREQGTLKLVLGGEIARGDFVAGKMIGGLAAVLVPFLLTVALAVAGLSLWPGFSLGASEIARISIMVGAAVVYASLFFGAGLLISSLAGSAARALVLSLLAWSTLVFALPNLGALIAEDLAPVASAESQELARYQAFVKNRFISIQSDGKDPEGSVETFNREYDRLSEAYRINVDRLTEMSRMVCRVAPAAAVTFIFTDLAGTGLSDHRRLSRALAEFKTRNLGALLAQNAKNAPPLSVFDFPAAPLSEALRRNVVVDLGVLGLMAAGVFAAAAFAFVRIDPR